MPEFVITLNCYVEAKDDEAAVALAEEVKAFLAKQSPVKLRSVEVYEIEEM